MALPGNSQPTQNDAAESVLDRLPQLAAFRYRLRQFLSFSEIACEAAGLTTQQYQLLQMLGAAAHGTRVTISTVADRLLLRHNSAVELVDRAERAELVQRAADSEDHRRAIVEITPRGQQILTHLTQKHLQYLADAVPDLIQSLETLVPTRATR